ncbi:MAG TPA: hypothetical protein VOA87_10445 [Thermoanaerobaculia bacterium]|nr:hypothetical protein [Thermoanaerobaculia bacterium]
MRISPKVSLIVPVVAVIVCLVAPAVASACVKSHCAIVPIPGNPFCRQCIIDGGDATAACRPYGNCGCIYFQCAAAPSSSAAADWRTFVVGGQIAGSDATASPASGGWEAIFDHLVVGR